MSLLEKSSSIEISRRTQPFYAKKQSYALGQQVQIEVDLQREFIDFESSRLVFDVNFTAGTPTGVANSTQFNRWAASAFIKNLRVKTLSGQMIGHEIREYRAWCRMYKELKGNSDLNQSYYQILEGATPVGDEAAGLDDADVYKFQFAHKFMSHLFTIKEYYPAHFHQGLMIEFDLPTSVGEIWNVDHADNSTLPTLTNNVIMDNPKYVCD